MVYQKFKIKIVRIKDEDVVTGSTAGDNFIEYPDNWEDWKIG